MPNFPLHPDQVRDVLDELESRLAAPISLVASGLSSGATQGLGAVPGTPEPPD
jgi:hypothetical protein